MSSSLHNKLVAIAAAGLTAFGVVTVAASVDPAPQRVESSVALVATQAVSYDITVGTGQTVEADLKKVAAALGYNLPALAWNFVNVNVSGLPTGLSFNKSNFTLSGTVLEAGQYTVQANVTVPGFNVPPVVLNLTVKDGGPILSELPELGNIDGVKLSDNSGNVEAIAAAAKPAATPENGKVAADAKPAANTGSLGSLGSSNGSSSSGGDQGSLNLASLGA